MGGVVCLTVSQKTGVLFINVYSKNLKIISSVIAWFASFRVSQRRDQNEHSEFRKYLMDPKGPKVRPGTEYILFF